MMAMPPLQESLMLNNSPTAFEYSQDTISRIGKEQVRMEIEEKTKPSLINKNQNPCNDP